jgi:uncharacterized protein YkwD
MIGFTRRGFVVLASAALVSSCTTYTFETANGPAALTPELATAKINEVRRANGHKPLTYNARLAAAARSQAQLMASRDELSHNLGVTLRERVTAAGYVGAVGENLAGGHKTLEAAIEGWLASPAHRSTLLSDKFTEFGIATASVGGGRKSRYGIYWALIMGGDFAAWYT